MEAIPFHQPECRSSAQVHPWSPILNAAGVQWGQCDAGSNSNNVIFVLGNAYGRMPYQEPLAISLAASGFNAVWTTIPGQNGAQGHLSLAEGTQFLRSLIDAAAEEGRSVGLLCHCASTIGALDILNERTDLPVRCLISYGPLLNLASVRKRALPRLRAAGIEFDLPDSTWNYPVAEMFAHVKVPTLIAHSRDRTNQRRATTEQVEALSKLPCVDHVYVAERGYDDSLESISIFCDHYIKFLSQNLSADS